MKKIVSLLVVAVWLLPFDCSSAEDCICTIRDEDVACQSMMNENRVNVTQQTIDDYNASCSQTTCRLSPTFYVH